MVDQCGWYLASFRTPRVATTFAEEFCRSLGVHHSELDHEDAMRLAKARCYACELSLGARSQTAFIR